MQYAYNYSYDKHKMTYTARDVPSIPHILWLKVLFIAVRHNMNRNNNRVRYYCTK